jgi:APA family basic amino acid/polyamine antiporter
MARPTSKTETAGLRRRLGLFDATMIVMGGIIGAGIFMNPREVAQIVDTPALILTSWLLGGLVALAGSFIYAELAARRPQVGGQYAYIREAFHPALAFMYGWALLLVVQTGGMAAVAITFARHFIAFTRAPAAEWLVAALALLLMTAINCFGVRAGAGTQSALMVVKIFALAALIFFGFGLIFGWIAPSVDSSIGAGAMAETLAEPHDVSTLFGLVTAVGAAMVPVLFSYGGWQTANFIAGEVREPRKNLPRGLLMGVVGVIVLYMAVNYVCVGVLGAEDLARTGTPAAAVMRQALGERGESLITLAVAISALGFLSQAILTAPRVYFAMAEDGLFFRGVAWVHPRTRVPVVAIALQGALAIVIALSGTYGQILSYVVSVDSIFFGLTAASIFYFRRVDSANDANAEKLFKVPGHPVTTLFFLIIEWLVAVNTFYKYPVNSMIGFAILLAGVPAYLYWRRKSMR